MLASKDLKPKYLWNEYLEGEACVGHVADLICDLSHRIIGKAGIFTSVYKRERVQRGEAVCPGHTAGMPRSWDLIPES